MKLKEENFNIYRNNLRSLLRVNKGVEKVKKAILSLNLLELQQKNPKIFDRFYEDLYILERPLPIIGDLLKKMSLSKGEKNFFFYFLDLKEVNKDLLLGLLSHPQNIQAPFLGLEIVMSINNYSYKLQDWKGKYLLGLFLLRYFPDKTLEKTLASHLAYLRKKGVSIIDFEAPMVQIKRGRPSYKKRKEIDEILEEIGPQLLISQKILKSHREYGVTLPEVCEKKREKLGKGVMEDEKLLNLCLRHFYQKARGSQKYFLEKIGRVTKDNFREHYKILRKAFDSSL